MIRHNDVTTDGDAMFVIGALRETNERIMNRTRQEQFLSSLRAGRHEENWIAWEELLKPWRNVGVFVHWGAGIMIDHESRGNAALVLRIAKRLQKSPSR